MKKKHEQNLSSYNEFWRLRKGLASLSVKLGLGLGLGDKLSNFVEISKCIWK